MAIYNLFFFDQLLFNQTSSTDWKVINVRQYIQLNQFSNHNMIMKSINQNLNLNQSLSIKKVYTRISHNFLALSQRTSPRVKVINVSQVLNLTQSLNPLHGLRQQLNLTQSLLIDKSKKLVETLLFNENVHINRLINLNIVQELGLIQRSFQFNNKSIRCNIGNELVNPPLGELTQVVFSFNGLNLILPSPDFSNTEQIDALINNNTTKGGDIHIFRDTFWPSMFTLKYRWTYLSRRQVQNIFDFINQTIGQIVQLVDYEGRTFQGIITTPNKEFTQLGISNREYELEIELVN